MIEKRYLSVTLALVATGLIVVSLLSSCRNGCVHLVAQPLATTDSRYTAKIGQDLLSSPSTALVSRAVNSGTTEEVHVLLFNFTEDDLKRNFNIQADGNDVLVFMHIQKTSGSTFGRNLVRNLDLPCMCDDEEGSQFQRCPCYGADGKRQWLYSRYSTGWICGLHADFTEWTECLADGIGYKVEYLHRQRNYLLFTILREPRERYISEWLHVRRGATWSSATLRCNRESPSLTSCYDSSSWIDVELAEFLACPHNLAHNRQTRMLANLSVIGCYDEKYMDEHARKQLMLSSAKENLRKMAFFGLMGFQNETQYLFEKTFNLKFKHPISDLKPSTIHSSRQFYNSLPQETRNLVDSHNDLDIQLYEYAYLLFMGRYTYEKNSEKQL